MLTHPPKAHWFISLLTTSFMHSTRTILTFYCPLAPVSVFARPCKDTPVLVPGGLMAILARPALRRCSLFPPSHSRPFTIYRCDNSITDIPTLTIRQVDADIMVSVASHKDRLAVLDRRYCFQGKVGVLQDLECPCISLLRDGTDIDHTALSIRVPATSYFTSPRHACSSSDGTLLTSKDSVILVLMPPLYRQGYGQVSQPP
jgi:hypothetical protein